MFTLANDASAVATTLDFGVIVVNVAVPAQKSVCVVAGMLGHSRG